MYYLQCTLIAVFFLMSAQLHAGQDEYDECILKHLKNARHDVATHFIRQACYENYMNPTFVPDKRKAYNNCLLKHLGGVESFEAVMEISNACGRKYQ